ncbi:MAG TPA: pyridoxamine 5'-phosphate oxidase family protein [Pseudonocardiaceae bacterium]|jgi:pyridoxamine 5'-phosphate oxidase|nr:pyridoxamine 5'-phosphate oxidase family protein [Pseudonocardiaceae bacterium]
MSDRPAFDPDSAPADPIELLRTWLSAAVDLPRVDPLPRATVLSTVDEFGHPDARVVMLRGISPAPSAGLSFASSALSPKGRQLADTPWAALTFHWPGQGRQVRVRGQVTAAEGAADFAARPPGSRAEVVVGSRQSEPLSDLAELRAALASADVDAAPADWTQYTLRPAEFQFFQIDPDRVHVRLRYDRADDDTWRRRLQWP